MLNFGVYKPTHIPRPIERIGKMLETLDNNNRRIVSTYQGLDQALSTFDINVQDNGIVNETRQQLLSGIEDISKSNDGYMEGKLNRMVRDFTSNPALRAAIQRNAEYKAKKQQVHEGFLSGQFDRDQYTHYYNQAFKPTQADHETGAYVNTYDEFEMPAKMVNIPDRLMKMMSQIQSTKTADGIPNIEYLTKKEFNEAAGVEVYPNLTEEEALEETPYVKYIRQGGVEYRTPEKIGSALLGMLGTDKEAMDYINDRAKITGISPSQLIQDLVAPYKQAGSFYHDNTRYQAGSGQQQARMFGAEYRKQAAKQKGTSEGVAPVLDEGVDISKDITPSKLTRAVNTVSRSMRMGRVVDDKVTLEDSNPNKHMIDYASQVVTGKLFNELSAKEQRSSREKILDAYKNIYGRTISAVSYNKVEDDKASKAIIDNTFGAGASTSGIRYDNILTSMPNANFFDFTNGRVLDKEEMVEYIKEIGKADGSSNTGAIIPNYLGESMYSPIAPMTGKLEFNRTKLFNFGTRTIGVSDSFDEHNIEDVTGEILNALRTSRGNPGTIFKNIPEYMIDFTVNDNGNYDLAYRQNKSIALNDVPKDDLLIAVSDILYQGLGEEDARRKTMSSVHDAFNKLAEEQ